MKFTGLLIVFGPTFLVVLAFGYGVFGSGIAAKVSMGVAIVGLLALIGFVVLILNSMNTDL